MAAARLARTGCGSGDIRVWERPRCRGGRRRSRVMARDRVDRAGSEVLMRSHKHIPALVLLLALVGAPAHADGRWTVSLGVGQSVSELHGSAIEAAAYAQLHPLLGLGLEGGMAYMQIRSGQLFAIPVEADGGAAGQLASLTDGLTRNRGLFVGPALRVGQQLYALASAGVYEFSDNNGNWLATRWGGSAGLGLTGKGRFSPRAEARYRWSPGPTPERVLTFTGPYPQPVKQDASALVFTIGANLH